MSDKVKKLIEGLARKQVAIITVAATVTAVNLESLTCDADPLDGGAAYFDVRLRSVVDDSEGGLVVIPKVGSTVLISLINNSDQSAYVSGISEAEEIWMKGTDYGGMVKVGELNSDMEKVKAFMQAVQNAFSSWVTVPNDGGAALKVLSSAFTSLLQPEINYENEKVKHGSV